MSLWAEDMLVWSGADYDVCLRLHVANSDRHFGVMNDVVTDGTEYRSTNGTQAARARDDHVSSNLLRFLHDAFSGAFVCGLH